MSGYQWSGSSSWQCQKKAWALLGDKKMGIEERIPIPIDQLHRHLFRSYLALDQISS